MLAVYKTDYKKIKKLILDEYWGGKRPPQVLRLNTPEDRVDENYPNTILDVCLESKDKKRNGKFLFTIVNYNAFFDLELGFQGNKIRDFYDSIAVASTPYYLGQTFFVRTWKSLTDEDIHNCAKYFINNVLDLRYKIWNIRIVPQTKAKQEELFDGKVGM